MATISVRTPPAGAAPAGSTTGATLPTGTLPAGTLPTGTARVRDREATRRRMLEAARGLFAEHGYDHVTVRMIAAASAANVALISRYFGSKAALFGEVVGSESTVRQVVEGDPGGLPRRLAEHLVRQIRTGPESAVLRALDRSVGSREVQPVLRESLEKALVGPLTAQLTGPDARQRALLATSVLMGPRTLRRLLMIDDLQAADPAMLTERLTAIFEICLS
ncbi:TetR/AcrR family transcriptional regulator [Actinomadura scrupuli]|uniref:TetR/AcrR family transcriptional regulator n=1 Tax=Actinomadura scrupuli TaxID=559629 RepID=UPI003D956D1B